jgi:hypothetical protein
MSQTVRWSDITEEVRRAPSALHDRVAALMGSLDNRYRRLGATKDPSAPSKTRLSEWVNNGVESHKVGVIGATYVEEPAGPLRRVFAVIYDPVPSSKAWSNMRVELFGIDHEYPEHRDASQWTAAHFRIWFRDIRCALVALAVSGDPMMLPENPPTVPFKAYVPRSMKWQPMKAFLDYIFSELDGRRGGALINPPRQQASGDWVDYAFELNCS